MNDQQNIKYYISLIFSFLILKYGFRYLNNDSLIFLLKPINKIVSIIFNSKWNYSSENGFFHENLNIFIDRSCSGYNFLLIAYVIIFIAVLTFIDSNKYKLILFPISIFSAYLFTIIVNTSRIITSIFIQQKIELRYEWLHRAEGVFINLTFLISIYLFINYFLSKIFNYEKYS